jgi:hypothetical protein
MTHKSTALQVAGRTVRLVNLNNRLYVPMRFLVEDTLGMRWDGQRKRLAGMSARWRMADLLVTGNRKTVQQLCLPVGLLLPYLWMIRPSRPEVFEMLERLRDRWEESLLAYLKFDGSELANAGGFMLAEIERATLPLIARIDDLKRQAAAAEPPARTLAEKRWKEPFGEADFLEMARRNRAGESKAAIADDMGCSRTTVSLFLSGKYRTPEAMSAMEKLPQPSANTNRLPCVHAEIKNNAH